MYVLCCPSDASPRENLSTGVALPTGMALPTGARDQDDAGRRNSVGKAKGKGKKSDSCPPSDSDLEVLVSSIMTEILTLPHFGRMLLVAGFERGRGSDMLCLRAQA